MEQEVTKRRLRLCADCVMELLAPLLEGADVLEGNQWTPIDAAAVMSSRTPPAHLAESSSIAEATTSTYSEETSPEEKPSAEHAGHLSQLQPSQSSKLANGEAFPAGSKTSAKRSSRQRSS